MASPEPICRRAEHIASNLEYSILSPHLHNDLYPEDLSLI
jgi:hypothetical protein